ncbi:Hypothetical predicted protein [Scomber scombrus]|uniref:Uncharacterized protein n=1 Tax=Scomber scombrus TaxID=13677 RepID=A0AAV1NHN0_SCOSC
MDASSEVFISVAACQEKVDLSQNVSVTLSRCVPSRTEQVRGAGNVVQQSKPDEWMNGGGE